jgi:hypothetical protein
MLRGFVGVGPEIVVAFLLREASGKLAAVKEVTHDAVRGRPIIAIHAVVVRTQRRFPGEL